MIVKGSGSIAASIAVMAMATAAACGGQQTTAKPSAADAELVQTLETQFVNNVPYLDRCRTPSQAVDCVLAAWNPAKDKFQEATGIELAYDYYRYSQADNTPPSFARMYWNATSPDGGTACVALSIMYVDNRADVTPGTCQDWADAHSKG